MFFSVNNYSDQVLDRPLGKKGQLLIIHKKKIISLLVYFNNGSGHRVVEDSTIVLLCFRKAVLLK